MHAPGLHYITEANSRYVIVLCEVIEVVDRHLSGWLITGMLCSIKGGSVVSD